MYKNKSIILVLIFAMVLALDLSSVSAAETKVGYLNLNRLVNESAMGKAGMKDIGKIKQQSQNTIAEKLKRINDIKIDLEAKTGLKAEDKKDRIDELNTLIKEYKRMTADSKEDIQKEYQELVARVMKKADNVLKSVAKKKKYTMILTDPKPLGYLDPSVDITNDVLKELNKK